MIFGLGCLAGRPGAKKNANRVFQAKKYILFAQTIMGFHVDTTIVQKPFLTHICNNVATIGLECAVVLVCW